MNALMTMINICILLIFVFYLLDAMLFENCLPIWSTVAPLMANDYVAQYLTSKKTISHTHVCIGNKSRKLKSIRAYLRMWPVWSLVCD